MFIFFVEHIKACFYGNNFNWQIPFCQCSEACFSWVHLIVRNASQCQLDLSLFFGMKDVHGRRFILLNNFAVGCLCSRLLRDDTSLSALGCMSKYLLRIGRQASLQTVISNLH